MAGLKKRKQERSSSPNIVLVIFLVFFFLLTIGLGIFSYYGYAEQADLRKAKQTADAKAKSEALQNTYWKLLYRDLRVAMGADDLGADALAQDERNDFLSESFGRYSGEPTKEAAKKLMDDIKTKLPGSDNAGYGKSNVFKELKDAQEKAKEWEAAAKGAMAANKRMEDIFAELRKKNDAFQQDVKGQIDKNSADQLKEVTKRSDSFEKYVADYKKLNADLDKQKDDFAKYKEDQVELMKGKEKEIGLLNEALKKAGVANAQGQPAGGRGGETFPLVLDISPGKPLWDNPIGKIITVNMDTREVAINLGADQGAKPELTFNIFGANSFGRAEKQLRGTIEITKVLDANTSRCRITSLYDAEGREILLQGRARFQLQRESEAPLREGDLLYNLFWGTRVAVAGYVAITGEPSDNPAEQYRQMNDFMHLLRRNGMQVDAYVDMRDGKTVGSMSPKTRYLILGYNLRGGGDAKAPKAGDDDKDKEPAKGGAANAERNDTINKASQALREEARDNGMLQISADNFAVVIGYRRARNALVEDASSAFRPSLPDAGSGRVIRAAEPDRPREQEKKAPEMEKKDKDRDKKEP
jgi:hypothetical protein